MTVDELQVLITANTQQLQKEIAKTNSTIAGLKKSAEKGGAGVMSAFKKLKTGIVALGIGKVIADSIKSGMDAVESDSLFDTSLGNMADDVRAWSDEMAEALGLSAVNIRKNTGVIYNMTTSMGLANDNALKMSKGVSILANDMASFYNMSEEEAFNKIQSGLTGMSKPLKDLGILVDDATITQVAYQEGIAKTGEDLTEQQKVLARYVALLKQTGNAQGDLARTIDSPANQLRILKNQVSQLGLAFSNFLLPMVSAVLPYITAFTKVVTQAINTLAKFLGLTGKGGADGTSKEVAKIGGGIGGVNDGLKDADKSAKKLKGTLAGFDEMNVLQDTSSDSGGTGGGGGGAVDGGSLDFDLSEYDAHLDWIDSKTDAIVENIKNTFMGIGDVLKQIWNSEPMEAFVGYVTTYGQFLWDYWTTLGTSFVDNVIMTWGGIQDNVGTILSNMSQLWTLYFTDLTNGIQTYGKPIIDGVNKLFNSVWKDAFDPYIKLMTKAWADFSGILLELWQEHGQPLIDNIGEFVTNTIGLFQDLWDKIIEPIVTPFLEMLSKLWDEHLKGIIKDIGDLVMSAVNGALEIYNKFVAPIVSWLIDKLSPIVSWFAKYVIDFMSSTFSGIAGIVSGIIKSLKGIIDFLVGVFTGDWKRAWDGVKNIFGGIFDALKSLFKTPINWIIDGINSFIRGLNKIKIPDWVPAVGGKGFHINEIPKLARGGVVDRPTMALIGEAGKEAIIPMESNLGAIEELSKMIGDRIDGGGQPTQIIVKLGEDTIFDKFIDNIKERNFESNGEVFV